MKATSLCVVPRAWILLLSVLFPIAGFTDGIVIPQRAYALPRIPDQRALIHYAEGTETLVIETSFAGEGTNFAWIVPLPTEARIQAVSTGLFPTLQTIFQPKIVLSVRHWWLALPVAAFLSWLVRLVRRGEGAAAFLVLGIILVLLLWFLPLLSGSKAKSFAGTTASVRASVRVISRQNVGSFDTALVKSADPTALFGWLNENGFSAPTNIVPVVADYVRDGWVFAAARLNCEPGPAVSRATHPLAFTFKTNKPVYPLRLTAKGADNCRIELYIFGPDRAAAAGFKVERCEAPQYDIQAARPALEAGALRIRHTELAGLVSRAPVATKLSAALNAAEMQRDLYIQWGSYWASGQDLYTVPAALTMSGNLASFLFMALVLVWWSLGGGRSEQVRKWRPKRYWFGCVAVAAGFAWFLVLPKVAGTSFRMARESYSSVRNHSFQMAVALGDEMADQKLFADTASERSLSKTELDRLFQAVCRDYLQSWSAYPRSDHPLTNFFTGEQIRFEASPGNFVLRPASRPHSMESTPVGDGSDDFELVWHDFDGAEMLTNPIPSLWRSGR